MTRETRHLGVGGGELRSQKVISVPHAYIVPGRRRQLARGQGWVHPEMIETQEGVGVCKQDPPFSFLDRRPFMVDTVLIGRFCLSES